MSTRLCGALENKNGSEREGERERANRSRRVRAREREQDGQIEGEKARGREREREAARWLFAPLLHTFLLPKWYQCCLAMVCKENVVSWFGNLSR